MALRINQINSTFLLFKRGAFNTKIIRGFNVMVVNSGSSSIKFRVLDPSSKKVSINGIVDRLNSPTCTLSYTYEDDPKVMESIETHGDEEEHEKAYSFAMEKICNLLKSKDIHIGAVGHRVVHGGETFKGAAALNEDTIEKIKALIPLAPLHNPPNILGIEYMGKMFPFVPQVAVFDTSFHLSLPEKAYRYPIPESCYRDHGIRRFGFHGLSHQYVIRQAADILGRDLQELSIISAHLGNGCSVMASKHGQSLDTSMGLSPLEGLMMGQRSGDVDPMIIKHLVDVMGVSLEEACDLLNRQSGMLGITGTSGDSRDVEDQFERGCPRAALAIDMFCYRLAKYVAAYATVTLGGNPDAIVFTGGIGEKSHIKRGKTIELLTSLGLTLDPERNRRHGTDSQGVISEPGSRPAVLVVPTNEEMVIARETVRLVSYHKR